MKTTRRNSAFTLIEMVVVIGIIMLLASILFPVFAQVQEKARASSCSSNLKQIGVAFQMYLQDYDHRTVFNHASATPPSYPRTSLDPYIKNNQVWICPSETNTTVMLGTDPRYVSYQFNNQFGGLAESRIVRPTEQVITHDSNPGEGGWTEGNSVDGGVTTDWPHQRASCASSGGGPNPAVPCGMDSYLEPEFVRHNGKFNALYLDGHAKTVGAKQFNDTNFRP